MVTVTQSVICSKTSLFVSFGKHYFLYSVLNPVTLLKLQREKMTYSEAKDVISFKIDNRIVYSCNGINHELVMSKSAVIQVITLSYKV